MCLILGLNSQTMLEVNFADEAAGANQEIAVALEDGSSVTFWFTAVMFRRGRLTGSVAISGIGLSDQEKQRLQGKVEGLASVMNDRVASVLAATDPTAAPAAAGQ